MEDPGRTCTLCGFSTLLPEARLPDKADAQTDVLFCPRCQCFVPDYYASWRGQEVTRAQVDFHEEWWRASTDDEMQRVASDLQPLVRDLQEAFAAVDGCDLVVELGAGRGSLTEALRREGYRVLACEPSSALAGLGHRHYGLTPETLRVEEADDLLAYLRDSGQSPACVVMWHVLEHLEDPIGVLRQVNELLPLGGHLAYQVPLLFVPYLYPEHRLFMTERTPELLAAASGFRVVSQAVHTSDLFMTVVAAKRDHVDQSTWDDPDQDFALLAQEQVGAALAVRDRALTERDVVIEAQAKLVDERGATISQMSEMVAARDAANAAQARLVDERDVALAAQARLIDERWTALEAMGVEIAARDAALAEADTALRDARTALDATRLRAESAETLYAELAASRTVRVTALIRRLSTSLIQR